MRRPPDGVDEADADEVARAARAASSRRGTGASPGRSGLTKSLLDPSATTPRVSSSSGRAYSSTSASRSAWTVPSPPAATKVLTPRARAAATSAFQAPAGVESRLHRVEPLGDLAPGDGETARVGGVPRRGIQEDERLGAGSHLLPAGAREEGEGEEREDGRREEAERGTKERGLPEVKGDEGERPTP